MRLNRLVKFFVLLLLLVTAGVGNVWADRGHGHARFGIFFGPAWDPWYRPAPYYYPPIVIERAPPPVYIEQSPPPAPEPNYWYFCAAANAYYPYVKECPSGWQRVSPQPPSR